MRFTSTAVLLTSLAAGIHAGVIAPREEIIEPRQDQQFFGTFDTFTDTVCSEGGSGITVDRDNVNGPLDGNVKSIKAYLPTCYLAIWNTLGGFPVRYIAPGDNGCYSISGTDLTWRAYCYFESQT
ncbi:hypothetical protein VFPPC_05761 [Pochonia chlamydosporia 170]|uniref:Uncharacterized protein n=1 Tax=Pochonia chlamydosporia 170 TaxID=1380566 RepID=A0A179FFW2_METCM|nr:hypothetical protein VFPPC_05761 [Pochonia chlamydosporia 170]OAQ64495.1 hypothetical protein VFPPC_05761 [Pochonia chlamydosporia 170]